LRGVQPAEPRADDHGAVSPGIGPAAVHGNRHLVVPASLGAHAERLGRAVCGRIRRWPVFRDGDRRATGHIGSAVVPELRGAGHEVVGRARSDKPAAATAVIASSRAVAARAPVESIGSVTETPGGAMLKPTPRTVHWGMQARPARTTLAGMHFSNALVETQFRTIDAGGRGSRRRRTGSNRDVAPVRNRHWPPARRRAMTGHSHWPPADASAARANETRRRYRSPRCT
jgi:hypothetical protein